MENTRNENNRIRTSVDKLFMWLLLIFSVSCSVGLKKYILTPLTPVSLLQPSGKM